ncbi:MAG: molybdate ABC transporter permease subunit [Pseudomonadota bacterium]
MTLTEAEWEVLFLSLRVAATATIIGLPIAFWAAWSLARRRVPFRGLVKAIIQLPLVLPPVVVGYLLIVTFGRQGWIGGPLYQATGISIAFTTTAAVIATGIVAFPLMVRACRLSIETLDPKLEAAARVHGASPTRVFWTLSAPLCLPGILAATTLGFARGFGEFGATLIFAANIPGETRTLPIAIYTALQSPTGGEAAARLVVISVTAAVGAFLISEWLERRTRERLSGESR